MMLENGCKFVGLEWSELSNVWFDNSFLCLDRSGEFFDLLDFRHF